MEMKVKVVVTMVFNTKDISDIHVRHTIERAVFNKTENNTTKAWAEQEAKLHGSKEITLELI